MYIYKGRLVKISENIAFLFYKEIYKKYLILYYKTEILLKVALSTINQTINHKSTATFHEISYIRVITKLPNSEQSYKEKVKTHISFATLFRVVANEDLVNPGDVLAEQQTKCTCLYQGSQGFTILRLFTMGQKVVSCFSNHIMQVTPLFNIIINFYNVISLFVHRNMYMFVFLF